MVGVFKGLATRVTSWEILHRASRNSRARAAQPQPISCVCEGFPLGSGRGCFVLLIRATYADAKVQRLCEALRGVWEATVVVVRIVREVWVSTNYCLACIFVVYNNVA